MAGLSEGNGNKTNLIILVNNKRFEYQRDSRRTKASPCPNKASQAISPFPFFAAFLIFLATFRRSAISGRCLLLIVPFFFRFLYKVLATASSKKMPIFPYRETDRPFL